MDEESLRRNRNATPQYIGALTELVWTQIGIILLFTLLQYKTLRKIVPIENVAGDLESFCNHAGRSTVTTDDVLLLARKNPDLHQIMEEFIEQRKASAAAGDGKGKKGRPKK